MTHRSTDSKVVFPPLRGEVAIVGMACTYPGARNVHAFWNNIVRERDCITEVPPQRWNPELFYDPDPTNLDRVYCKRGGYLPPTFAFNPLRYGTMPRAVTAAEPDQFLVLRCAQEALDDAGCVDGPRKLDGKRTSFVLGRGNYMGAGLAGVLQRGQLCEQTLQILGKLSPDLTPDELNQIKEAIRGHVPQHGPETAPGLIPNLTTGRVANRLDLMGPNFCVDAACASSLIAIELAVLDLLTGRYDLVLAGGVHIFTGVPFLQVFAAMGALSQSGTIRPFDRDADGTLSGEGVGILALKRLDDAVAHGDRIYAVIKGVGTSSDGRAMSVAAPRVDGEELALRRAYDSSGVAPETVALIECHGTATPTGDPAEIEAMRRVFPPQNGGLPACAIGSIKSMIGHAMPAAGAAGMIKTALALHHGVLPATLHCRRPPEELIRPDSRFYVNTKTRPWIHGRTDTPRRAGVSAFGFGGINAHVVLEEYRPPQPRTSVRIRASDAASRAHDKPAPGRAPHIDWDTETVLLEADTPQALAEQAARLRDYLCDVQRVPLRDIAFTCNTALTGRDCRMAIVADSNADLADKLDRAARRLAEPDCKQIKDTKGIYYFGDSPVRGGKLAFLFPGEGAQYLNMLSDLCIHFPEVRACFEAADRAVSRPGRLPPSADIFPPPFFDDAEREAAEARLWSIDRATESVLTADGAMFTLLDGLGIQADLMAGHSAGEWIALAAAGVLDIDEFVASMDRLDAMYQSLAADATIPKMAMLAVGAGRDKVLNLVAEIDRTVHVANDNCPHQVVIVSSPEDAEPVTRHLRSRGVFVERLPYDRGYHTPVFTYICEPLREFFSALKIQPPAKTLFSCTTAAPYPTGRDQVLDLVADTFASPLLFRETIEAMYAQGSRIFLEVGPRGNLTAFVDDMLRGRPHAAIATDQQRRTGTASLNHAIAQLAALHVPMDLERLYEPRGARRLQLDPKTDPLPDPDAAPGTMQVSICYPELRLDQVPPGVRAKLAKSKTPEPTTPQTPPAASPPAAPEPAAPDASSAVIKQHLEMMERFLQTQEDVMRTYLGSARPDAMARHAPPESTPAASAPPAPSIPDPEASAPAEEPEHPRETEPAPAKQEAAATPANVPAQRLEELLINIVSDKTGYPPEMLDLDVDMEAELGIDSIKRIEILGALQESAADALPTGEVDLEQVARLKSLREVLSFLRGVSEGGPASPRAEEPPAAHAATLTPADTNVLPLSGEILSHTPDQELVIRRRIHLDEDLYLLEHCLDPKASDFEPPRYALPVVPLTVSVEMMAEAAARLRPDRRVIGLKGIQASRWIDIDPDTRQAAVTITARAGNEPDELDVSIRPADDQATPTASPYAVATVILADRFPDPPPPVDQALQNPRTPSHTAEQMYEQRRMFHGPRFQGVAAIDEVGEDGLRAQLQVLPFNNVFRSHPSPSFLVDPFILDAAGQLVGYWPVEYLSEGFVLFPIKLARLTLFGPNLEPGERAECRLTIREVSQRQLRADMDLLAPDGKLWMRIEGWEDWRFFWTPEFYDFWRFPNKGALSEPLDLPRPAGFEDIECRRLTPTEELRLSIWENLWVRVILSRNELQHYRALPTDKRRKEWLYGRAAAKDAVRLWIKRHYGRDLYPADVEILTDSDGRPSVAGPGLKNLPETPQVSISHKGQTAVAAAGRQALGIDLEQIQSRDAAFEEVAFTQSERELLKPLNGAHRNEWLTRVWCAKEAASKVVGLGFSNGPATMVVTHVEPAPGAITVACGDALRNARPDVGDQRFVVHSIRAGDLVVALALPAADDPVSSYAPAGPPGAPHRRSAPAPTQGKAPALRTPTVREGPDGGSSDDTA